MERIRLCRIGLVAFIVLLVLSGSATVRGENRTGGFVQNFLNLQEEDCIELSLDVVRRGIQQEDVRRVMRVVGDSVSIKGAEPKLDNEFAQDLGQVFANSSKRSMRGTVPTMSANEFTTFNSNLRDFDILSPCITIRGDSAFVDCELILWYAVTDDPTRVGSRTTEQFVFWSPANDQPDNAASRSPLRWQLVGCRNLFDFLSDFGDQRVPKKRSEGGRK